MVLLYFWDKINCKHSFQKRKDTLWDCWALNILDTRVGAVKVIQAVGYFLCLDEHGLTHQYDSLTLGKADQAGSSNLAIDMIYWR